MLLARSCPSFPPVANHVGLPVALLWNSGWGAFLSSSLPPPFCSQNAYELAVQKIQSSYVKDKSKQTSKGRDEEACCIQRLQTLLSALRPPAPAKRTQPLGTKPGPEPGLWFQGSWHCSFFALFVLMELRCVANRDPCSPPCLHEAAHTVIHADKAKLP